MFREALSKKAETDDTDAIVIAQLLRYEFVKERKNLQRQ